jgi:flagellar biosynthesis/type III secretory pathway M-ring protein FliF/YscJ
MLLRATPQHATDSPETHDLPAATARSRNARIDEPAPAKPTSAFHERIATTNSLRGELAEMVREDPDVAANILRNWIGNSST